MRIISSNFFVKDARLAKTSFAACLVVAAAGLAGCEPESNTVDIENQGAVSAPQSEQSQNAEPVQIIDTSTNLLPGDTMPWSGTALVQINNDSVTITDASDTAYAVATNVLKNIELSDTVTLKTRVEVADGTEHSTIRFGYTEQDGKSVRNDVAIKHDTKTVRLVRGDGEVTSDITEADLLIEAVFTLPYGSENPYIEIYPASGRSDFNESAAGMASITLRELSIK